jgi:hypothetical protein
MSAVGNSPYSNTALFYAQPDTTSAASSAEGANAVTGQGPTPPSPESLGALEAAFGDFGATALSLPNVVPVLDMAGMSTADLLQVIAAGRRETTQLLMATQMESIKALKQQIEASSNESISKLMDAAKSMEKAEHMQQAMKVVKWVALAVAAVVSVAAIVFSAGAAAPLALALFSAALMIGTTCLSEIKGQDGKSPMDKMMEGLSEAMTKFAASYGELPPLLRDAIVGYMATVTVALALLSPQTLSLTLPLLAIAVVGALPDKMMSDEMKGQIMASIVMVGAMLLLGTAASVGAEMLKGASTAAATTARTAAQEAELAVEGTTTNATNGIQDYAQAVKTFGTYLKGVLDLAKAGGDAYVAVKEYKAAEANALVMALKEQQKMYQTLLDRDASFVQELENLLTALTTTTSNIVEQEHQNMENVNSQMQAYS